MLVNDLEHGALPTGCNELDLYKCSHEYQSQTERTSFPLFASTKT